MNNEIGQGGWSVRAANGEPYAHYVPGGNLWIQADSHSGKYGIGFFKVLFFAITTDGNVDTWVADQTRLARAQELGEVCLLPEAALPPGIFRQDNSPIQPGECYMPPIGPFIWPSETATPVDGLLV